MPLIGGSNGLPLVHNFDPSTWTIPSMIRYGLRVPELVNWHDLSDINEDIWSLMSDELEDGSEDLNVHSLLPPLEHVGSPTERENPPSSEPSTSNLATSTSFGPPPVQLLGLGVQLLHAFQQLQQAPQSVTGSNSPFASFGRSRGMGSFQSSVGNWPPSGYFDQDPDALFLHYDDEWD